MAPCPLNLGRRLTADLDLLFLAKGKIAVGAAHRVQIDAGLLQWHSLLLLDDPQLLHRRRGVIDGEHGGPVLALSLLPEAGLLTHQGKGVVIAVEGNLLPACIGGQL
ncbi:hypothetical protein D3C80_835730 [compost metagenome]